MAYIKAISSHLPSFVLTNEALQAEFPDEDIQKLAKDVGVKERHIAEKKETASDLAYEAAKKMFADYAISPKDIDFVIYNTQCPDYFLPSTSCILQDRLGIPTTAGAFDFDLGCSGWAYGIAMAKSFIKSGFAKNILLLAGDTSSKNLHPKDKNRALFGDGATATLISTDGFAEIGDTVYGTDGRGANDLILNTKGFRNPEITGFEETMGGGGVFRDDFIYMNGEAIFNFTLERVPILIEDTLTKNNLTENDIDHYVFHQANKFMLSTIRKTCGIEKEKFYINLEKTGNTTSSSIPIGLEDLLSQDAIKKGQKVMIAGYGVGLSWAATILSF